MPYSPRKYSDARFFLSLALPAMRALEFARVLVGFRFIVHRVYTYTHGANCMRASWSAGSLLDWRMINDGRYQSSITFVEKRRKAPAAASTPTIINNKRPRGTREK